MIKPAYSVSFLLSINIFVWQNVLYFLDAPRRFLALGKNSHIMKTIKLFIGFPFVWPNNLKFLNAENEIFILKYTTRYALGVVYCWT